MCGGGGREGACHVKRWTVDQIMLTEPYHLGDGEWDDGRVEVEEAFGCDRLEIRHAVVAH